MTGVVAAAKGVIVSDAGQRLAPFGLAHCPPDVADAAVAAERRRSGVV